MCRLYLCLRRSALAPAPENPTKSNQHAVSMGSKMLRNHSVIPVIGSTTMVPNIQVTNTPLFQSYLGHFGTIGDHRLGLFQMDGMGF